MKRFRQHRSTRRRTLLVLVAFAVALPLVYFTTFSSGSAGATANPPGKTVNADSASRFIDNVAFGVGETLKFDINYGFINAGTATMQVASLVDYNGRTSYQIKTQAFSNSFFSSIYPVEDEVTSIIDADGLFSWHFEKRLHEGNYRSDRKYGFDQAKHVVYYEKDTLPVAPFAQDALSALYYVRTQPLEVGKSIYVESFVDGKTYRMEVKVHKKENIKVAAGTFDCVVVEPLTQAVGVFKHEGRLTVWLTDDRLRMPVLMKSKVLVGSISAELTDFKLGEIRDF